MTLKARPLGFRGNTIDDLLRSILECIWEFGEPVEARKGSFLEIRGLLLELTNPRARLSRSESRGKSFSCLGELCWYLSGSDGTGFVSYYIPLYEISDEGGKVYGAYGPRLFAAWKGTSQFENLIELLKLHPTSRRGVLQLFDSVDLVGDHLEVPCTCSLQFINRDNRLHLFVYMRSNDAIKGLTHDIFCFTMLQEIVARRLGTEMGSYYHTVGSLHLYDEDKQKAKDFLAEGWQSTRFPMPSMPIGDPREGIAQLIRAETVIRGNEAITEGLLKGVDPYWADLIRLLQVYRCRKIKDTKDILQIKQQMASTVYDLYM
jgi:thymidylate synthase